MSEYVICINNESNPASLVVGKVYRTLPDAEAQARDLLRVIDEDTPESDGYLYSASMFAPVKSREIDMIKLRPYQLCLLRQVQIALSADTKARVMMQLPTGGGKTIIAGALLAEWLRDGRKAVWLTHRKELAEQTCRMLTDTHISAMTDVNWTPGTDAPAMSQGVIILMAQTVGRRIEKKEIWDKYGADDLMVIDEAHHAAAEGWERAMRQWPGRIVGMTATPWRLSKKEGFDHLFGDLLHGPQIYELQQNGWLCDAEIFLPPPGERIIGGAIGHTGDYTESGIELANQDHPDVMTAGALRFWQRHVDGRPTIAYAVSVDHAHNLSNVFNNAGVPAAVILGDSSRRDRDQAINNFIDGNVKVLINVIVATEGFDLPDASCIVIARPTKSLSLYLQMIGRGLRPKDDYRNCLILDLAANSEIHGLPEERREWSLKPRGTRSDGETPVIWCRECEMVSPAANRSCLNCGYIFGKDCGRCGKWRSWKHWKFENFCDDAHELVCDLCHVDAHIQAHLPVTGPLNELVRAFNPEYEELFSNDIELNDELSTKMIGLLKELLKVERQRIIDIEEEQCAELRRDIERREEQLNDDLELEHQFEAYIRNLSNEARPANRPQEFRMYGHWEQNLRSELDNWKSKLFEMTNRSSNREVIFNKARDKMIRLLKIAAQSADLLPYGTNDSLPIKPPGKKKNSGKKQNDGIEDYLMPVIELMTKEGKSHTEAFRIVADRLNVLYGTVASQCTRTLGINTEQFVDSVANGSIFQIVGDRFPSRYKL